MRLVHLLAIGLLLALPLGLAAQEKKAEPKPDAKPEAAQPEAAQPEAAQPETAEPAAEEKSETPTEVPPKKNKGHRPYTATEFEMENMSDIEIENYGKIVKIREDSIAKMKNLVDTTPNYPNIADIYYRIAEFMTENTKYKIALQAREYRKDYERFKAGKLDKLPEAPKKDYSASLPLYETILMEHPKYYRVEEVLFYLGRNGVETGRSLNDGDLVEKSVKYLNKLEKLFPESQFLPKAFLLAAEYYFQQNNLFEALKYYKKLVEQHKEAPMYLYALYKQGWVYYNYQQYDKALANFEEVIQSLREEGKEDNTLRHMTLKDYVITISEAGLGWTSARDFLKEEIGEEATHETLHSVAQKLADNGFYDDSVAINNYFITLDQNAPRAVEYWNAILNIYRFNFPFEETEKQVRGLRFFFRPDGPWAAHNKANADATAAAKDLLVKWELSLGEFYLAEGLYFNKGDDSFLMAIRRLEQTLEKGAGKRTEQAYAGILLARQGLFRSASEGRVIWVAENVLGLAYPDDYKLPQKLRTQTLKKNEAGYMTDREKYLALADRQGQKPDLKPLAAVEMEAEILYTAALINYVYGHQPEGLKDIDALVALNPKSPYLGWAGDMIYDMSARAKDWAGLQRRMKAMLDAGNTQITPEGQCWEYYCSGLIQEALVVSKEGQHGDALEKLSQAAQACTDNINKAAEALYHLGETAEKAGFVDQAKKAYKKVLDKYSKSKYRSMAKRKYDKLKRK